MQHDLIISKFGTKLYGQGTGIPMGSNYVPLIVDVFVLCYDIVFTKICNKRNDFDFEMVNLHTVVWSFMQNKYLYVLIHI